MFAVPTAISDFGNALYTINAHFDVAPPPPVGPYLPNQEYEVVRVGIAGKSTVPGLHHVLKGSCGSIKK